MFTLNTDGGARGNPGPSAIAYILKDPNGALVVKEGEYIGEATNNVAEYKALIKGLSKAQALEVKTLNCLLDSELVVKQIKGEYRVKETHLKDLCDHTRKLADTFDFVQFTHVKRDKNKEADKLVNDTLDALK